MISTDQVTALAPDAASFKAGKALAVSSKWTDLGQCDYVIWGLAKGSGKKPYQTQVNVAEFVYKCSCPSRKFPCKHALGLMFIAADDLSLFSKPTLPDWVQSWVDNRDKKQSSKKKKVAKPKNPEAAERSRKKRAGRVEEGVIFLQGFLLDLIRQGLGQTDITNTDMWDGVSRRLIDYQAPGLAAAVKTLADLSSVHSESQMLHEMGALYLLVQSYLCKDKLSHAQQAEIDQRIGWQVEKETVLSNTPVKDNWFVAFRSVTKPSHLTVYSTWVVGQNTGEWALLLGFSAAGAAPTALWPVGRTVTTELAYYPGAVAERALPVDESPAFETGKPQNYGAESVNSLLQRASVSMANNPWRYRFPFLLRVVPIVVNNRTLLVDAEGQGLPWKAVGKQQLLVSAICGGSPTLVAGEWDGYQCHLYAADDNGAWFALRDQFS